MDTRDAPPGSDLDALLRALDTEIVDLIANAKDAAVREQESGHVDTAASRTRAVRAFAILDRIAEARGIVREGEAWHALETFRRVREGRTEEPYPRPGKLFGPIERVRDHAEKRMLQAYTTCMGELSADDIRLTFGALVDRRLVGPLAAAKLRQSQAKTGRAWYGEE